MTQTYTHAPGPKPSTPGGGGPGGGMPGGAIPGGGCSGWPGGAGDIRRVMLMDTPSMMACSARA
eukprot:1151575-Pelagomonas_calceolata.AAC.4